MAITAINITKFSAARIEGSFTNDGNNYGDINIRLINTSLSGFNPPDLPGGSSNNEIAAVITVGAAGVYPFILTNLGACSSDFAGLAPHAAYKVNAKLEGASTSEAAENTVSALEVKAISGPRSDQLAIHMSEASAGVLDPNSRMDLREFLDGELQLIKTMFGSDDDALHALGIANKLSIAGSSGSVLEAFAGSCKEALQLLATRVDANSGMAASGTYWNPAVNDTADAYTNLVAATLASGAAWVVGDAAWHMGDSSVYIKVASGGDLQIASGGASGSPNWGNASGSTLHYSKLIDLGDVQSDIGTEGDAILSLLGLSPGATNFGGFNNEGTHSIASTGNSDRKVKRLIQDLLDEDIDLLADIDRQDQELTRMRAALGLSSASQVDFDLAGGDGEIFGDNETVLTCLTKLELQMDEMRCVSFTNGTVGSTAIGDVTNASHLASVPTTGSALALAVAKSWCKVYINGVLVAAKSRDQGGNAGSFQIMADTSAMQHDIIITQSSKA